MYSKNEVVYETLYALKKINKFVNKYKMYKN